MDTKNGLVQAYVLDGEGGGRSLGWADLEAWKPERGLLWIHLDRMHEKAHRWLEDASGLEPTVTEALLAEETRPRSVAIGTALLLILRGVNLNPGTDPEDMVSIRLWVEPRRIISMRGRRLMAAEDVSTAIAAGGGPRDAADFVVMLADRLVERMSPVLTDLDDEVDDLEDRMLTAESHALRPRLAELRRKAITLRRYLAPQREALSRLQIEQLPWLDHVHRMRLRETNDRVTRYVEDLDAARERAAVVHDELANRLAEHMNRTMYALAMIATIFLPLSFVTGLLGINVGGIPGAEEPWAFAAVVAALAGLAALQVLVFRRLRWL